MSARIAAGYHAVHGPNLFTAFLNNPLTFGDPTGTQEEGAFITAPAADLDPDAVAAPPQGITNRPDLSRVETTGGDPPTVSVTEYSDLSHSSGPSTGADIAAAAVIPGAAAGAASSTETSSGASLIDEIMAETERKAIAEARWDAIFSKVPPEAPAPEPPPVLASAAESGTPLIAAVGSAVTAVGVVGYFGMVFSGDTMIKPKKEPTAAELDQLFVRHVREQDALLSLLVEQGIFAPIQRHEPRLYHALIQLADTNPATAVKLFYLAYGRTLESMVADALANDPVGKRAFERLGGASRADFRGLGPLGGALYDITTHAAATAHNKRPYGERLRIVPYTGPRF